MREHVVKEDADGYYLVHGDAGYKSCKLGFCERFVLFKAYAELHTLCKNELGNEVAVIGSLAEPFNAEIISLVVHGLLIIKLFKMDKLAQAEDTKPSLCKMVVTFGCLAKLCLDKEAVPAVTFELNGGKI